MQKYIIFSGQAHFLNNMMYFLYGPLIKQESKPTIYYCNLRRGWTK